MGDSIIPLPNKLVNIVSNRFPDIYEDAANLHRISIDENYRLKMNVVGKPKFLWDENVFIPTTIWTCYSYLEEFKSYEYAKLLKSSTEILSWTIVIEITSAWRPTQDIVKFDKDVYEELKNTNFSGILPINILENLPAWGVYIDLEDDMCKSHNYNGLFITKSCIFNEEKQHYEKLLIFDFYGIDNDDFIDGSKFSLLRFFIPLYQGYTVEECFAQHSIIFSYYNENENEKTLAEKNELFLLAVNMAIYICTYGLTPGIKTEALSPKFPKPFKSKKGWKFLPPAKPKIRILGQEFGELLRKAREQQDKSTSGYSVRPHVRRAHWHGHWTGKRSEPEKRKLKVSWHHPCIVGGKNAEVAEEKC